MKFKSILIISIFSCISALHGQSDFFSVGLEAQQYPTGFIPGIRAELGLSNQSTLEFRIGANIFDHQGFGVQEEESGEGSGGSIGYRYYFSNYYDKFFLGVRIDIWLNRVDWRDGLELPSGPIAGTSNIIVFQPTIICGYVFQLGDHFRTTPTISGGLEWNVKTEGEPTGEGPIILWGLNLGYRI